MNQYDVRETEIQQIVKQRQTQSEAKQQWDYRSLTRDVMMAQRFKYQNVQMSHHLQFVDDIRNIIYDEKTHPDDADFFSRWNLAPFEEKPLQLPDKVPPQSRITKKGLNTDQWDKNFGQFQLEGNINAKSNQIHYTSYHFNLRTNSIFFYPAGNKSELQSCQCQTVYLQLNQRTFDYLNFNTDYFYLRGQQKNVRIKRDEYSSQLIRALQKKLLILSFKGSFALRDQVPPWQIQDYIQGEIDRIGPIHFQKQNHVKQIVKTKYYKQTLGAFFTLLKKFSSTRNNVSGQIYMPRWLKTQIKQLPNFQLSLSTNLVPSSIPLQSLTIKIQPYQIQPLISSLKYVFPFYKNYLKRNIIVYDSQLTDQNVKFIISQVSYPMYHIGFPNNNLSILSLQNCIVSASNLYQQVIDFSYNSKLTSIGQNKLFNLINTNPSIKKLMMKGCYVQEGQEQQFFEGLTNNLCLCELQIDFLDHYGNACVKYLKNYSAHIY